MGPKEAKRAPQLKERLDEPPDTAQPSVELTGRRYTAPTARRAGGLAVRDALPAPPRPELRTPETLYEHLLRDQLSRAFEGYNQFVHNFLQIKHQPKERPRVTGARPLIEAFDAWLSEPKLDYLLESLTADPELRFTLVATPNVMVAAEGIVDLAHRYGTRHGVRAVTWDSMYRHYPAEALSGFNRYSGRPFIFSLIPNKLDDTLAGRAADQDAWLQQRQRQHRFLRVPSVLESLSYLYALRAHNLRPTQASDSLTIGVRQFTLHEETLLEERGYVPYLTVDAQGAPQLIGSPAEQSVPGCVAIG